MRIGSIESIHQLKKGKFEQEVTKVTKRLSAAGGRFKF